MAFIPAYILILLITILIDFFAGILIEKSNGNKKKLYLIISIISTCLVLAIFKYFDFFINNLNYLAQSFHWNYALETLGIILPIGLSFHTFQSLSYVIEVYKGNQKAEYNFGIYALYVMFYPQLVAGPIERPQNLLHQFYEKHYFEYERVVSGIKLMAWGFFKKLVIADRVSIMVNNVYDNPQNFTGIILIIATVFFAFQIYCDFSGYSDIAIGSAKVMGFKLMTNFNYPYSSKSIAEFWKRWHISLSTWFKDYLYISLGGNRVSKLRYFFNIFVTFLVSGFWHGANWTYVIWGIINGLYMIFFVVTKKMLERVINIFKLNPYSFYYNLIAISFTFSLICFSWIFFRAKNITDAFYISKNLFKGFSDLFIISFSDFSQIIPYLRAHGGIGISPFEFVVALCSIIFLIAAEYLQIKHITFLKILGQRFFFLRWGLYYIFLFIIFFLGVFENRQFIYFQF